MCVLKLYLKCACSNCVKIKSKKIPPQKKSQGPEGAHIWTPDMDPPPNNNGNNQPELPDEVGDVQMFGEEDSNDDEEDGMFDNVNGEDEFFNDAELAVWDFSFS